MNCDNPNCPNLMWVEEYNKVMCWMVKNNLWEKYKMETKECEHNWNFSRMVGHVCSKCFKVVQENPNRKHEDDNFGSGEDEYSNVQ